MDLAAALDAFDRAAVNLTRAERVWAELEALIPSHILFGADESGGYHALCIAWDDLVAGLPAINGWTIANKPVELDNLAQWRLDALEIGELSAQLDADAAASAPGRDLTEYKTRLNRARRTLVRRRAEDLLGQVDRVLPRLQAVTPSDREPVASADWTALTTALRELDRLIGDGTVRQGRWPELRRHVAWSQGQDLHDIAALDWPSVRADVVAATSSDLDPMSVGVADLGLLADAGSTGGPVAVALHWERLTAEDFERLLFNLISDLPGFYNTSWLTNTTAPDRGRDLSADKEIRDSAGLVLNQRIIVQAKHWQSRSVRHQDITEVLASLSLWEPPVVHHLIFATSGRFTGDAVTLVDKHNASGARPLIDMWPESRMEGLIAERPHLAAEFGLR